MRFCFSLLSKVKYVPMKFYLLNSFFKRGLKHFPDRLLFQIHLIMMQQLKAVIQELAADTKHLWAAFWARQAQKTTQKGNSGVF